MARRWAVWMCAQCWDAVDTMPVAELAALSSEALDARFTRRARQHRISHGCAPQAAVRLVHVDIDERTGEHDDGFTVHYIN